MATGERQVWEIPDGPDDGEVLDVHGEINHERKWQFPYSNPCFLLVHKIIAKLIMCHDLGCYRDEDGGTTLAGWTTQDPFILGEDEMMVMSEYVRMDDVERDILITHSADLQYLMQYKFICKRLNKCLE